MIGELIAAGNISNDVSSREIDGRREFGGRQRGNVSLGSEGRREGNLVEIGEETGVFVEDFLLERRAGG